MFWYLHVLRLAANVECILFYIIWKRKQTYLPEVNTNHDMWYTIILNTLRLLIIFVS